MQQVAMNPEFRQEKRLLRWAVSLIVAFGVTAFMLAPAGLRAQIAGTGNIQGTVTDPTGAVVANASVALTEEATHVKRTTVTSSSGVYLFPSVPVGTYDISVISSGFKNYVQRGIVLEVGSSIAINPTLSVGTASQSVEVQAEGLALQTEDPTFKQTIDHNEMTAMPLNGRHMTDLITLSGGSAIAPNGDFTGSKYSYQTISISIAGGGGNTTLWRLDGGDNQDYMANGNLPYPFPEAVSQFSVESTVLGAQDGGHIGGEVNVVTQSGTNAYHGEAFEYIRNNFVDATNFFSTSKDTLHQNQFGGTFGGPVIRNKLFAFAGYQRTKADQSQASTKATVPTAANLAGDFSTTDGVPGVSGSNPCNSSHAPIQLVDPLTGAALTGNKYSTAPTYSPAAIALEKYLPKIDPSYDTSNCGFVSYSIPYALYDNEFVTRVDWTLSSKHNIFGRYFIDGYQFPAYFDPTNILTTTQSGNIQRVQSFVLGDAYTFSPNLVNSAHLTIMRRVNNRGYNAADINGSNLGISLYYPAKAGLQISEGKFTIGGGTNSLSHFNDNTGVIGDDVTWVRGKHQIMFGGEWVQNQLNIGNIYEGNGTFTFNGEYSGSGPAGGSTIGDQNLDFLKGTLSAFQQSKQQQNALRGPIPSLYIQDTFHASPRLTITGGLRWNPNFMPVDYFNRGLVFNSADFLANVVSTVYPLAPAGVLYYGDKGVTRQFTKNTPWQFSPNLGVSFDPTGDGKTVIRAGGELAYDNPNFFTAQRNQQNPPYATAISNVQTSSTGPLSFDAPWSVGQYTTSPFPQPAIPGPTQTFAAQSQYIFMVQQFHAAYTIQWTLSVQHEFGHGWQVQVDYIGNATRHDPIGFGVNTAVYIPGNWGAGGTGCTGIVTTGPAKVTPGAAGTPCSTTKNQTSRFALTVQNPSQGNQFAGGGGGSVIVSDTANASYNGMVATLQHRLSSTFSLLTNWTWSKCLDIDDASGDYAGTAVESIAHPSLDWGPCGSDFRHIINMSLVARSNFHRFNALGRALINGWEFSDAMHIQSGAPLNITAGADNSLTDVGNDRPSIVPGVNPYLGTKIHSGTGETNRGYLNPAAFQEICPNNVTAGCAAAGTYGNVSRNAYRGPKFFGMDSQIDRNFPIHERLALDLRLEAFNVLNHPNFQAASLGSNISYTSSTFGQISSTAANGTNNTFGARVFQGAVHITF
ncbi:MAG TPA: carboxypeptidase-like regulatory domain-containing protein [Terracidiphilus sp.]|nr:carboxypeptidase-like regulatory domain-containing protein [Terracidiphilus sp.]